jgi:hypothetical protein
VEIVVPSNGATISDAGGTGFRAIAYDPDVGTSDGQGINSVKFDLTKNGGGYSKSATESQSAYCFYGGDGPCNTSPDWASLPSGTYTLTATASGPGKPSESVSVTFTKP